MRWVVGVVLVAVIALAVGYNAADTRREMLPYGGEPRPLDDALRAVIGARSEDARSRGFVAEEAIEPQAVEIGDSWSREIQLEAGQCVSLTLAAAGCLQLDQLELRMRPVEADNAASPGVRRAEGSHLQPQTVEACAWGAPMRASASSRLHRSDECPSFEGTLVGTLRRGSARAIAGPAALRGRWVTSDMRRAEAADAARAWIAAHELPTERVFGPLEVPAASGTALAPDESVAACREAYRLSVGASADGFLAPHVSSESCPPEEASVRLARGAPVNLTTGERRVIAIVEPGAFGAAAVTVQLTRLGRGFALPAPTAVVTAHQRTVLEDTRSGEGFVYAHRIERADGLVRYTVARTDRSVYRVEVRRDPGDGGTPVEASEEPWPGALELPPEVVADEASCAGEDGVVCRRLGLAYRTGVGAPADHGRAERAFERGCAAGDQDCCAYRAIGMIEAAGDAEAEGPGDELAERSCHRGGALSCAIVGDRHRLALRRLDGAAATARDAYRRACELELQEGCTNQRLMTELQIQ